MKAHPRNENVQDNGSAALCSIAFSSDNQVTEARAGGIVVAAMKAHPRNENVQTISEETYG